MAKNTKTPAMVLQELCTKQHFDPPTYEIIPQTTVIGTHQNRFDYRVCVAGIEALGTGTSKQISKHDAAHNALVKLKDLGIYNPVENPVQEFQVPPQQATSSSPFKSTPNCVAPLQDLCAEHKLPNPIFKLISDVGPPHSREFTYECNVGSIKTVATGSTKKMAKQMAAQDILIRITDVLPEILADLTEGEHRKAITDDDNQALHRYNELFGNIIPDKTTNIEDYSRTLRKLMDDNDKTIRDFEKDLTDKNEASLKRILEQLGLDYKVYPIQDNPSMVSLTVTTDTPLTTIGVAASMEGAQNDAVQEVFEIMNVFMRL